MKLIRCANANFEASTIDGRRPHIERSKDRYRAAADIGVGERGTDVKTWASYTASALITTGKPHVHGRSRAALAVGANRREIGELIIPPPSPWVPSANNAVRATREVLAELNRTGDRDRPPS